MITAKLLAGLTSLALTGAAAYYSLSPLNQAFAVQNDIQEKNNDTGLVLPEWIPDNTESMLEFINNYGKTYTGDGLACVVIFGGEEPETSGAAAVYQQEYSHPSYSKNIRIYVYQVSSELTVKGDYHTYTFVNDNGTVRENDMFSWLPDCITEYNAFLKEYGRISVFDDYIVFCDASSPGTGYGWINTEGIESVEKVLESDCGRTWDARPTGAGSNSIVLYSPADEGEFNFSWVYAQPWAIDRTASGSASKTFIVSEGRITEKNEDAENSGNEDGKLSEGMTAEENPDITIENKDESGIKGDINSDGKADITDLSELALALVGDQTFTETQKKAADVDGDGEVKLSDLAKFRQYLSKIIESLE